jgi:SagB-type dehydrogenase family enzyme
MKPCPFSAGSVGLTRRDFLKFLPIAGGALLLNGCTSRTSSATLPAASPDSGATVTPETTATHTISPTPEPSSTFTLTPELPPVLLPQVDGSFSFYALPTPQFASNMPLLQSLQERHSNRKFRADELPVSMIASILWAGFGVNRTDGKRTAPSAYDVQDIDIYLATSKGLFSYDAPNHSLVSILPDDLRTFTGTQGFVAAAPLNLVYVSDYSKFSASNEECMQWSWAHSGCIAQNVYLACAALGLATVVRSTINRATLAKQMSLNTNQHITLSQTVGYPA